MTWWPRHLKFSRRSFAVGDLYAAHWDQEYDRQYMIYLAKRIYRR